MSRSPRAAVALGDVIATLPHAKPPPGIEQPPFATRVWERAVGPRIASKAHPWRLERGVLLVRVRHAVWANELTMLEADIRAQLALHGIEVEALRFKVGRLPPKPPPPPIRRAPRPVPLPRGLERALAAIDDDELRSALARAASLSLGRRR